MMDQRAVSPEPVMKVVSSNGQSYDQVDNSPLNFVMQAKGRCENLHWVKWGRLQVQNKTSNKIHYSKEVISSANINQKTWSNSWKTVSLTFNPDTVLKQQAAEACNQELNKRIQQGGNKLTIMKQGFSVLMHKTVSQFNFTCRGPSPLANHPKSVNDSHPVRVSCGSFTPKTAVINPATMPKFALKGVDISMNKTNYQGVCPAELPVKAVVTANPMGGKFQYRFIKNGQPEHHWKEYTLAKNQTQAHLNHSLSIKQESAQSNTSLNKKIQQPGQSQVNQPLQQVPLRSVSIEVKRPGQQLSDIQQFQATCAEPKMVQATYNPSTQLPDLASRVGFTLGTVSAPWGGHIKVAANDAVESSMRGCKFRFKYDVINIGSADSAPSVQRLSGGGALHTASNFTVSKGSSRNVSGHVLLKPGQHVLVASLDHTKQISEIKENNNLYRVRVTVDQNCSGAAESGMLRQHTQTTAFAL
ncbi:CARDB domain-containing protein [Gilvimarinus sp. 2_MG-2023]|uniref:CARDB domain-containing protein n=1 Tax=Gilvimarinus sp. 2_MG-2023 TaxID=3062666 RepID=UPI0026E20B00|nr:CARDB domain-containing protein [Gilvimarinus sp. 2_MG-2023]